MPTLNWIGKDKVVSHHLDVPYKPLEKKYAFVAENGHGGVDARTQTSATPPAIPVPTASSTATTLKP